MSSKEVKVLLKESREAIKIKEYQVAIRKCKEILRSDKKNGMAFVLLGAAYQDKDKEEAAKYLKLALEISDEFKLLALQGLSNCAKTEELSGVFEELLKLAPEKYSDYYTKLSNITNQLSDHSSIIKVFCNEIKLEDPDRKYLALKLLLNVFMKNRETAIEMYQNQYLECLEIGFQDNQHVHHVEICRDYLKVLHIKGRLEELTAAAERMTNVYPNNTVPLEWICKVFIENENFPISQHLKSNFGIYVERVLELNSNSVLGLMASGLVKFAIGDLASAREIFVKVNQLQPSWTPCLQKLATIHMKLRAYLLAELVLRQLKDNEIVLAESLIEQQVKEKLDEGLKLLENKHDVQSLELLASGLIYSREFEKAEIIINKLKNLNVDPTVLVAKLYRFKGKSSEAVSVLTDCSTVETHQGFLELGKNYFELHNYEACLLSILKATKLDPNNSECFYWLGKIYIATKDEVRSSKCLEKCLNLNPQNEKAISILSAVYRKNQNWNQNLTLLENTAKSVEGAHQKTAFFQLGLHHLDQQNYDNAITAFRNSLKYDSTSVKCWESLADSYFGRGSYSSALKVFQKSVELNRSNSYAKLQIARLKFILQQYQESIVDYEDLLKLNAEFVPALKGIAESHFGRAFYLHENHRSGRARDHCQNTLLYLRDAIQLEPSFVCLWRLLANVLDFVTMLPPVYSHLDVPAVLISEENARTLIGEELMNLASKCYLRCLKLNRNDDLIWFELVSNYYNRAIKVSNENRSIRLEYLKLAFEGAKHLVKLAPSRWQNWNILGIIAATTEINDPGLAQHSFIKATIIDKKTYTSWSNLGVFYLMQGNIKLANKAFGRAQQSDTTFMNAWIGQAIVAELIGEKDEAMDLFRHVAQALGFHSESSIAYPNFVCSVLDGDDYRKIPKYEYAIDKMFAIPLALDNINWNVLANSKAPTFEALTYVGYLSSRQGLWMKSIEAYERASLIVQGTKKDKCLTDLGYCYLKVCKNEEAVEIFNKVKEATFESIIGLALAYYKVEQYQDCYETYQKTVEWLASNDDEKAIVLVAMASIIYAFTGVEEAKMVLFQCIGLPSPPVQGLLSLCAISLIHKDEQLGELVIKELKKFEQDPHHGHHVSFLIAQFHVQNGSKADAMSYVLSRIHEYPDRPLLRKVLADLMLQTYKKESNMMIAASRLAQSSLILQRDSKQGISSNEASKTLVVASIAMQSVDKNQAKILAQKAVHINPLCSNVLKIC